MITDKRILKQTNNSSFSRKYYARVLQSRLNFSQYSFFIHKKSSGQVEFLFQPLTCKRAEVKRADSKEIQKLIKILVDNLKLILWPIKLASQMRLINFSPIINEYLRKENSVSPSIDTESELKK